MNVYLKEDIPARFHYQHSDRIQPIILVADEGWTIVLNKSSLKCKYLFLVFCNLKAISYCDLALEGRCFDFIMFILFRFAKVVLA